jgi:phage RecT family recombinase
MNNAAAARAPRKDVAQKESGGPIAELFSDPRILPRIQGVAPPGYDVRRLLNEAAACIRAQGSAPGTLRYVDQATFIVCLCNVAQLGLSLGIPGEAYLIPRKNSKNNDRLECTLQIGVNGWQSIALRTGKVASVESDVVYANDGWKHKMLGGHQVEHEPARGDRGAMERVYAYVTFTNGAKLWEFMDAKEVAKVREKASGDSLMWNSFPAMAWRKVCVKRLLKRVCAGSPLYDRAAIAERLPDEQASPLPEIDGAIFDSTATKVPDEPQNQGSPKAPAEGEMVGEPPSLSVPTVTWEIVKAKLESAHAAKDLDLLEAHATLLGEIGDEHQRERMTKLYKMFRDELKGAP